jgi:NADH-quinone oxidoreductase subunit J
VYAGAIMVLFLFVVMLLNAHTEDEVVPPTLGPHGMKIAVVLSLALAAEAVWAFSRINRSVFSNDPGVTGSISSVAQIGLGIFTTHAFAFEVTSILILVAMVGAVVIARKEP